ncbi:hypothetical protein D3C78_1509420 [compost metagenome]
MNQIREGDHAKPSKAPAVRIQLARVTFPVPNRARTEPLARLETIVLPAITMESTPAVPSDAFRSILITGHAAPSRESGNPKLINAK